MIRFFFRFLGVMMLALAFILLVYDGMKSIADGVFQFTALGQFWLELHLASYEAFRALVEAWAPDLWPTLAQPILNQPASLVLLVLSVLFILMGRRKRRLIGYARD